METQITLNCSACKRSFSRSKSKHEYNLRHGRIWFCCSRKCLSIIASKFYPRRKPRIVSLKCHKCRKNFKIEFNKTYMRRKRKSIKSFCSSMCKNNFQRIGGEFSPSWKGGRRIYPSRGGYVTLRIATNKRMLEHRYVMEKHIGRKLMGKEVVHHLNEDPSDNRIENLVLCNSPGQHSAKYHPRKINKKGRFEKIRKVFR